ncbi:uncharacterized protein [Aegilops tauschii subsp. strangulata]|uniref:uncharacterized protein n=1 Tax=Aegilops tauschii subsp. strangulata TaxID=200361 RepID=UPI003CC85BE4
MYTRALSDAQSEHVMLPLNPFRVIQNHLNSVCAVWLSNMVPEQDFMSMVFGASFQLGANIIPRSLLQEDTPDTARVVEEEWILADRSPGLKAITAHSLLNLMILSQPMSMYLLMELLSSNLLRRSTRSNKYDGFKVNQANDIKQTRSRVRSRVMPSVQAISMAAAPTQVASVPCPPPTSIEEIQQETKRESFDLAFIKTFCPKRFDKFAFAPSMGASGGIITIWNSSLFVGTLWFTDSFAVGVSFVSTQSNEAWNLVNVYGPCSGERWADFSSWLFDLNIPSNENWLLLGDFNFIRSTANRNKPGGDAADMLLFNEIIHAQSLMELPVKGRSYTWSNMQDDPLLEQLDWFFSSSNWTTVFPNTMVLPLGKPVSDHIPCVVTIESKIPKSKLFRFENYWVNHEGFSDIVQRSWSKPCHAPNSAALICKKMKNLRYELKLWSRGISKLKIMIQNSNEALAQLDRLEDKCALFIQEKNFRRILKMHLNMLLKYQNDYWRKRCTRSSREIILLKLDFAKAFDTIEHIPMMEIMRHMGFDDKWLGWMETIFGSGVSSVLLNGVPGRKFQCKCGVRQGDPLSPLIFVLAADLLQAAVNDAYARGMPELLIPCNRDSDYPVVQYADDTILVMPACPDQVARMKTILEDYAASVGLKINFHKSTLIPINLDQQRALQLAQVLGCSVGSMPFTYLGLPMGTTRPTLLELMPLVHGVERKMSTALSLLSSGAKLTLVNSVVTSMLIYAMCTIKLHPKVIEHLDKLRKFCLWAKNSEDGAKNNSLASWELVCRPKCKGGLGVIDIKTENVALLLKHLFKFYNHHDVPWVTMVWDTYYTDRVPHAMDPVGSFWWRDVMQISDIFRGITKVTLGNRSSSLFWKDVWFDDRDTSLMEICPRAFSFCLNENEPVAKILTAMNPSLIFHLSLPTQAREEVREIQEGTMHVILDEGCTDAWEYNLGGVFSSKRYYDHCFRDTAADDAFRWLWKAKSPIKFKMFGWLLFVDRLNTRNMLRRRHFVVVGNTYTCMLCQNPLEETVEHLFFTCPFSQQYWAKRTLAATTAYGHLLDGCMELVEGEKQSTL